MFRPNLKCEVAGFSFNDVYGKRVYKPYTTVPFAIVKMEVSVDKTSVRTDSSATRGSAHEILADARFLFPTYVKLKPGDRIKFGDDLFTVESVHPRYSVLGIFDHWQVDCNVWAG